MSDSDAFPENYVRIMCDYCADPVWAQDGGNSVLDLLPVSVALRAELQTWADAWEAGRPSPEELMNSYHAAHFDLRGHARWGLAVARRVKVELPEWTVIYYDEWAEEMMPPGWTQADRLKFEYPV